ncbi:MAG TPA: hypothetical protein VK158_02480, partial [Acidobacteriota bacterium]|nr:hypothetical protein [Acidobacteriota bacterium]
SMVQRQILDESDVLRDLPLTRKVFADYDRRFDRRVYHTVRGISDIAATVDKSLDDLTDSHNEFLSFIAGERQAYAEHMTSYLHACAFAAQSLEDVMKPGVSIEETHRDLGKVLVQTFEDKQSVEDWFSLHDLVTRYPLSLFADIQRAQKKGILSIKLSELESIYNPDYLMLVDHEKDVARRLFISNLFGVPRDLSSN